MSMKSAAAVLVVLVAILTGAYFSLFARHAHKTPAAPGSSVPANFTFYCEGGKTMQASFATSSVALALSDGRTLVLPQVVSGSGIRYEATTTASDVAFIGKGDNAFLSENGKPTYENCTAAVIEPSDAPGYALYTDVGKTFSFAFPSDFSIEGSPVGLASGWSAPAASSGMVLAKVVMPQGYEPGTNFSDARFTVGVSSDPSAIASCLKNLAGDKNAGEPATIGGKTFTKLLFGGAAAGNRYDTTSYRTLRGGECWAIEYTIHYGVLDNYPKGSVKAFDEGKVTAALDEVAKSFLFLQ